MSSNKFSDEFKRDAVAQITERGYLVREASERLGVSPKTRIFMDFLIGRLAGRPGWSE